MTNASNVYINALLADATYVNLTPGLSSESLAEVKDLKDRMTPTLAKYIADNFEVISSIDTRYSPAGFRF